MTVETGATPQTPGPVDDLTCARAWYALCVAHGLVTDRLSAALRRACGLSINEFEVLLRADREAGPGKRLHELNRTVRLSQPAFSRLVARLEDYGLLRRANDPADARAVLAVITPAGRDLLRRAVPVHAACLRKVLVSKLSPTEYELLAEVLTRVAADS